MECLTPSRVSIYHLDTRFSVHDTNRRYDTPPLKPSELASTAGYRWTAITFIIWIAITFQSTGQHNPFINVFQLDNPPTWIASGIWSKDNERIIVPDVGKNTIKIYNRKGKLVREIENLHGIEGKFFPSTIQSHDGSYILENRDGHLIWLDDKFKVESQLNILNSGTRDHGRIQSLFNWSLSGGTILAFGDISKEHSWESSFMMIPVEHPRNFASLKTIAIDDPSRNYFLLGHQYIASTDTGKYFLDMSTPPTIYGTATFDTLSKTQESPLPLQSQSISAALQKRGGDDVPRVTDLDSVKDVYLALESMSIPVGLFGCKEFLYILCRKATSSELPDWLLSKIDPISQEILHTLKIPINARHITAVPGEETWAFFSKGRVEGLGEQEISDIVFIDSSQIENSDSELLASVN